MERQLTTYTPMTQHTGTWLMGYDWSIYGCGTYAEPVNEFRAEVLMRRFMERLDRKLHAPVSYYAALERRYSGCGLSPIPLHWHFLAACPRSEGMAKLASELWEEKFGNAEIVRYDRTKNGTFYTCKLANHANGMPLTGKMEHLRYDGPEDLLAATQSNPYVPDHLKDRVFGTYLVVR
jgi:hypothetical protein